MSGNQTIFWYLLFCTLIPGRLIPMTFDSGRLIPGRLIPGRLIRMTFESRRLIPRNQSPGIKRLGIKCL